MIPTYQYFAWHVTPTSHMGKKTLKNKIPYHNGQKSSKTFKRKMDNVKKNQMVINGQNYQKRSIMVKTRQKRTKMAKKDQKQPKTANNGQQLPKTAKNSQKLF